MIAAAAAMLFAACGNNNQNNNQQTQNEPVVEEPVVEEPAAPENTTWDHYEWTVTMPNNGWKVDNAYSDMGIDYLEDWSHFNLKDWDCEDFEEFLKKQPAENAQDDIITDNYTWKVFKDLKGYKLFIVTYSPERKMAFRVGSDHITDPADERVLTVLNGFAFKPVE